MQRPTHGELTGSAEKAMRAAAASVIEISRRTGAPVIIWENGQIRAIPGDEIEREMKHAKSTE